MNIETVNELIASLESAGELSIREKKFLKLAKAFKQLEAENVQIKAMNVAYLRNCVVMSLMALLRGRRCICCGGRSKPPPPIAS